MQVDQKNKVRLLNCGSCVVCCQKDLIYLHPECGDNPNNYLTDFHDGRFTLKHKDNGDCIYLDKGCTIHGSQPTICKEMDCRKVYKKIKYKPEVLKHFPPDFVKAAKAAIKRNK